MRMSNGRSQTRALRDVGMYGMYAADIRYRQELVAAELGHSSPIIPRGFREWVGTALIRLGTWCTGSRADRPAMAIAAIAPRA